MSGKRKDLTGQKYGKLTVVNFSHMVDKHSYWSCLCDCGNNITVRSDCLKRGNVKSCGCLIKENHSRRHGYAQSRLYRIYYAMKQRCYNPKTKAYHRYGGRGVTICEEWLDSFESFRSWAIANGYRDDLTIDRRDVNGNYEPNNCRWITQRDQTRNTSRNTHITIDGVTRLLCEWCSIYGVNMATACYRLKRGWSVKDVFQINE